MIDEQVFRSRPSIWTSLSALALATVAGAVLISFGFHMPATLVLLAAGLLFARYTPPVHLPKKTRLVAFIVTLVSMGCVVGAGILEMGRVWFAASGAFLVTQVTVALAERHSRHTG